jgi:hypothetical protein
VASVFQGIDVRQSHSVVFYHLKLPFSQLPFKHFESFLPSFLGLRPFAKVQESLLEQVLDGSMCYHRNFRIENRVHRRKSGISSFEAGLNF